MQLRSLWVRAELISSALSYSLQIYTVALFIDALSSPFLLSPTLSLEDFMNWAIRVDSLSYAMWIIIASAHMLYGSLKFSTLSLDFSSNFEYTLYSSFIYCKQFIYV
jgi:hypothetical protein